MAVPLIGESLLFTQRSPHLPTHAGQIAFPGGVVEPGEGPVEAAFREAQEEVGLGGLEALGFLSPVLSPQGFLVQPVVAYRPDLPPLSPNPKEVERVFLAPIEELLEAPLHWEERLGRRVPHLLWRGVDIWGVTGFILVEFLRRWREVG